MRIYSPGRHRRRPSAAGVVEVADITELDDADMAEIGMKTIESMRLRRFVGLYIDAM